LISIRNPLTLFSYFFPGAISHRSPKSPSLIFVFSIVMYLVFYYFMVHFLFYLN